MKNGLLYEMLSAHNSVVEDSHLNRSSFPLSSNSLQPHLSIFYVVSSGRHYRLGQSFFVSKKSLQHKI